MALQLSTILTTIEDYNLNTTDERVMFDWLVWYCSHNLMGYRHSISKIQEELGIARHTQERIIAKFTEIGFLNVTTSQFGSHKYRKFFIGFGILAKDEVLCQIFKPQSKLYKANQSAFKELDKLQRSTLRPF